MRDHSFGSVLVMDLKLKEHNLSQAGRNKDKA